LNEFLFVAVQFALLNVSRLGSRSNITYQKIQHAESLKEWHEHAEEVAKGVLCVE
jgi:hypothetical protein